MNADTVVRPNGKLYRPRKPIRQLGLVGDYMDIPDAVVVLGTHDVEKAREFARPYMCAHLRGGEATWLRSVMRDGNEVYEYDPVRGAACVVFEETDDLPPGDTERLDREAVSDE